MDKKAFIFFGRSGSGKGTQTKLLIEYLQEVDSEKEVLSVESGQGLRDLADKEYYISSLVRKKLDEGGLFPEFLPIWIWTDFLIKNFTGKEDLVLDGVSRRLNEAPVVDGALDFMGYDKRYIIHLETSNEWSTQRLLERGRDDDNEKEIRTRLAWYDENVVPVIAAFQKNEKYTFLTISGEQAIEKVHQDIIEALS